MKASDIMNTRVASVKPDTTVAEIAELMLDRGISGVPVLDAKGALVGIVTEGDLACRPEIGTERPPRSWWLQAFGNPVKLADEFARSRGTRAEDIMTRDVITVSTDAPLADIAQTLEKHHIKRVPVVDDGKMVGIVSRANLVQGLASARKAVIPAPTSDDKAIRDEVQATLEEAPWAGDGTTDITVQDGVVELWGFVGSEAERRATRVAVEEIAGVTSVVDHRKLGAVAPHAGL